MPRAAWPAIIACFAAVLTFAICLRNDLVYDDILLLKMDPRLEEPAKWGRYWTESYNGGVDNLYRPLVSMTYAAQWAIHGLRPWPFFLVNILLHGGVSAAVAELCRRLSKAAVRRSSAQGEQRHDWSTFAAVSAGVLFATHPIHSEVVASVVGRAESMCAVFMLSAMILFCRPLTVRRAIAIWACSLAALLSKEQGLLLPLLLFIQFFALRRRHDPTAALRHFPTLFLLLLVCWTWAGYIVFREHTLKFWWDPNLLDWTQQPIIRATGDDRATMGLALMGRYLAKFFWPRLLSLDYGGQVIGWHVPPWDPYFYLGCATSVAWLVAVVTAFKRRKLVAVFLLWAFWLTFGLIGNALFLIGTNFAERLFYIPSAFLIVYIAMEIAAWLPRRIAIFLVLLSAFAGAIRTIGYVSRFDDRLRLYELSVHDQPGSVRLRLLLASELTSRNRLEQASRVADDAIALEPEYHEVYLMAAEIAMRRGDYVAAERYLNSALAAKSLKHPGKVAGYLAKLERLRAATQPR